MIKLENLKDGDVIELMSDVENPKPDRRTSRDWRCLPVIPKGFKFIVRENVDTFQGHTNRWKELEPRTGRFPGSYRLAMHSKPRSKDDDWWFLGDAVLKASDVTKLSRHDRFAQMKIESHHFASIVEVLLEQGTITFADVEAASKRAICEKCDALATKSDGLLHSYMCAEHNTDPNAEDI